MTRLNVLIIGGGGREHALAWSLAKSAHVAQLYVAPGNAGTAWLPTDNRAGSQNIPIEADDLSALLTFAKGQSIDLTIVGPEIPLALGIVDQFQDAGLCIFGPSRAAAQLEASKAFAKTFMHAQGIPTADYAIFEDAEEARRYLIALNRPVVVKADGLAAGKGVIVCSDTLEALAAVDSVLIDHAFGAAGGRVVIEELLVGPELSVLAFSDGRTVIPMPPARDHKRVFDADQGPNTGGMGAYAPVPEISTALMEHIRATILQPAVDGLAAQGTPYIGVLYAGLMLTADGPKALEFNARFGDPETQVLLPLLETDLVEVILACLEGRLDRLTINWRSGSCATVVLASLGYPGSYPKGLPISGLDAGTINSAPLVFHAGTTNQGGQVVSSGGRVLSVSGLGADLPAALEQAYGRIATIHFEGQHFRRDIGHLSVRPAHAD